MRGGEGGLNRTCKKVSSETAVGRIGKIEERNYKIGSSQLFQLRPDLVNQRLTEAIEARPRESEKEREESGGKGEDRGDLPELHVDEVRDDLAQVLHCKGCLQPETSKTALIYVYWGILFLVYLLVIICLPVFQGGDKSRNVKHSTK